MARDSLIAAKNSRQGALPLLSIQDSQASLSGSDPLLVSLYRLTWILLNHVTRERVSVGVGRVKEQLALLHSLAESRKQVNSSTLPI